MCWYRTEICGAHRAGEFEALKEKQYRGVPGGAADPCSRRRRSGLFPGSETEAGQESSR